MTGAGAAAVGIGAALGAWLRWGLGVGLNAVLPHLPLGTLAANLVGGYLLASVGVPVYCFICGGAMLLALVIFIMGKPFAVTEQA